MAQALIMPKFSLSKGINLNDFWMKYQVEWLKDYSQIKVQEKSRRIGATYVQSFEDVRDCIEKRYFKENPYRPLKIWFTSADLTAAKEYIDYCKEWALFFNNIFEDLGEVVLDEKKDIRALCIKFKNGAMIHALSSNPSQFRSKGGKVIIDEAAHHDDLRALLKAAFASAKVWGYPVRIISTHNGVGSYFNEIVKKVKADKLKYSLHTNPIQKAVEHGLADKALERKLTDEERAQWLEDMRADAGNEDDWNEEFCCIPIDEVSRFLTYELIQSCIDDNVLRDLEEITNDYYVGMDIGRRKDLSVIAGGEKYCDVLYTRQLETHSKLIFRAQKAQLYTHLKYNKFRRAGIDNTGIGANIAEDAALDFGKYRVEEITFTAGTKEELAFNLRIAFEDRAIRIPNDELLIKDLRSIRSTTGTGNHLRLDAERSETDGHGDRFWALALMLNAASSKKSAKPRVDSVKRKSSITQGFMSGLKGLGGVLRGGKF